MKLQDIVSRVWRRASADRAHFSDALGTAARSDGARSVDLGGIPTLLTGDADDSYFKGVEQNAAALKGFASLLTKRNLTAETVLDVGANIGLSTIILARAAAKVIAYEPSPANVVFLRRNLELNGIDNVEVRAAAASSESGTLRFHVASFGAGSHVVASGHVINSSIPAVEVPAVALDAEHLPRISFIKIDAEGHEPDVLAGARLLLSRDQPLIYAEVNIWCLCAFAGHSPGALVRTLWEYFDVSKADDDGEVVALHDPYAFLHETIVSNHGMADILLQPRAGLSMPNLQQLTWPVDALVAAPSPRAIQVL